MANQDNQTNEIETLKNYLKDYLEKVAPYYNPSKKYHNCILCRNPNHHEQRPSMGFYQDNGKQRLHCFSCGASYSLIDLVIIDYNLGDQSKPVEDRLKDRETIAQACSKIKELFTGVEPTAIRSKQVNNEDSTEKTLNNELTKLKQTGTTQDTTDYMGSRGIDPELTYKLKITCPFDVSKGIYLYIPYQLNGDIKTLTKRLIKKANNEPIDKGERYYHYGHMSAVYDPFNYLEANSPRVIFITEGELDTISYYQALKELKQEGEKLAMSTGAICLGGTQNYKESLLKQLPEIDTSSLRIVIALDNDQPGEQAAHDIALALEDLNIPHTTKKVIDPKYKDSNEYLLADKEGFKQSIKYFVNNIDTLINEEDLAKDLEVQLELEEERKAYINSNSVLGKLNDFDYKINHPYKPIRTGLTNLDQLLNGGFREGLITIGAPSGLGKTSLILQIADQIAQSRDRDILYYSLEMSTEELIARSLSRLMYLNVREISKIKPHDEERLLKKVKSTRDILNRKNWDIEDQALFTRSVNDYKTFAKNLYIKEGVYNFGVEDIKAQLEDQIEKTGRTPVVIIDYLQILAAPKSKQNLTDKQKTDENILYLKRLSRDYHTTIIIISSLNRDSYSGDVSFESFKESGIIEYTSDLVIGLNYYLNNNQLMALNEFIKSLSTKTGEYGYLYDTDRVKKVNEYRRELVGKDPKLIKLDILKNRSGANNTSTLFKFYPKYNIFVPYDDEHGEDYIYFEALLSHSRDNKDSNTELPY